MIIKIRDDPKCQNEPIIELYLFKFGKNTVELRGRDGSGHDWNIAVIKPEGIFIYGAINPDSGWPLDEKGRWIVKNYAGD